MLTTEDNPFKFPFPLKGNWRFLRKNKKWYDLKLQMFPPPLKVTEGSYQYLAYDYVMWAKFPYPPEVNGVSYRRKTFIPKRQSVSVPSQGEWGFLLEDGLNKVREAMRFSSPLEVIGGAYE